MSIVIDRIIEIRKHKGFTQRQVAKYLNVTMLTYGKWERKETVMPVDNLVQLTEMFDVNPEAFFYTSDDYKEQKETNPKGDLEQKYYDALYKIAKIESGLETITYKLITRVVGDLPNEYPFQLFSIYMNIYLNKRIDDSKGYKWFLEFIEIYNIDKLKTLYPDFFELAELEANCKTLDRIIHRYETQKKDLELMGLVADWIKKYKIRLYNEFYSNDIVFSFVNANEKDFESIVSEEMFDCWIKYKKIKEQG
ncbi:MAG: helix-turn-helix transcriptional regulator [Tenuifilaceae bacterium]|nr:helix-turn-helix transcriptional regulator [Tenuifilaceae bacterium]